MLARITAALIAFGPWGVFLLGFIDSAGIPVGPGMDAVIILMGVKAPDRAYLTALVAVLGSLGGNVVLFHLARRGGQRYAERNIGSVPSGRSRRFQDWFHRYGLSTVFVPALVPLLPLPLKVFVITAGVLRVPYLRFTAVVLLARTIHYFGVAWLAIELGEGAREFLKGHVWHIAGASVLLLAALYAVLRLSSRRPAGAA